ncbi:MAG: hypothetical protein V1824_04275 [archaeon]
MREFDASRYVRKLNLEMSKYLEKELLISNSIYLNDSRIICGDTNSNNLINANNTNLNATILNREVNNFNEDILKFTNISNKKKKNYF